MQTRDVANVGASDMLSTTTFRLASLTKSNDIKNFTSSTEKQHKVLKLYSYAEVKQEAKLSMA